MPVYQNSEHLQEVMQIVFRRVEQEFPQATNQLSDSKLIVRLKIVEPAMDVVFNGRKRPPAITYGNTTLRPDIDVGFSADILHQIMLGELHLGTALSSGKMKVQGNILKSFVLQDIFHEAQRIYPEIWSGNGKAR
jgi:putative sterol carrier protein